MRVRVDVEKLPNCGIHQHLTTGFLKRSFTYRNMNLHMQKKRIPMDIFGWLLRSLSNYSLVIDKWDNFACAPCKSFLQFKVYKFYLVKIGQIYFMKQWHPISRSKQLSNRSLKQIKIYIEIDQDSPDDGEKPLLGSDDVVGGGRNPPETP